MARLCVGRGSSQMGEEGGGAKGEEEGLEWFEVTRRKV